MIANRVSACLESMYGECFGLSVVGWRVMAHLGHRAPLSAKGLAERAAMNHVQVTRAVDQLVLAGLVIRKPDVADRRRIVLRLSRKGRRAYQQIVPLAKSIENALLEPLTEAERRLLTSLSARVLAQTEDVLAQGCDWRQFRKPGGA